MNTLLLMLAAHLAVMSSQFGSNIQVTDDVWNSYKVDYDKQYSSVAEEALRRQVFAYNLHQIDTFNRENPSSSYKQGTSHLSDMTDQEFDDRKQTQLISVFDVEGDVVHPKESSQIDRRPTISIPDQLDWRKEKNVVSEVKDQGQCKSSWAFAGTGVLEGYQRPLGNDSKLVPVSAQQLVDCNKFSHGCDGGSTQSIYEYVARVGGIESDSDYPYIGTKSECMYDPQKVVMTDEGFIPVQPDEGWLTFMVSVGPVAVVVEATANFNAYKSGIFDDPTCKNDNDSRFLSLLVVGYGTTDDDNSYWIVKNSWGKGWGEEGYIRMTRGKDNQCGIASMGTVPVFRG